MKEQKWKQKELKNPEAPLTECLAILRIEILNKARQEFAFRNVMIKR